MRSFSFALTLLMLGPWACGVRTLPGEFEGAGGEAFESDGGAWATGATGGVIFMQPGTGGRFGSAGGVSTGGRPPIAAGGAVPTGGAVTGGGGGSAGGVPVGDSLEHLVPYLCLAECSGSTDCPSAAPYSGACNGITDGCTITCDTGCPPGTRSVDVNGGCFCFMESTRPYGDGCCSDVECGDPYFMPCCDGRRCVNGRCR